MFSLLILALSQAVGGFEYLRATIHSQDAAVLPRRELWHPHLYLAQSPTGLHYELRNSYDFYDVSISFLETQDTEPAVMNCHCSFELENSGENQEENNEFLQVIVPGRPSEVTTPAPPREIDIRRKTAVASQKPLVKPQLLKKEASPALFQVSPQSLFQSESVLSRPQNRGQYEYSAQGVHDYPRGY